MSQHNFDRNSVLAIAERRGWNISGWLAIAIGILAGFLGGALILGGLVSESTLSSLAGSAILGLTAFLLSFMVIISPGNAYVVQFFGRYIGTVREEGLRLLPPLTTRKRISIKVQNFESSSLKVNDGNGNPVQIGAVVVWRIADTAKSAFAVEFVEGFVGIQAEAAIRHVAGSHPYETADPAITSLSRDTDVVADELVAELTQRFATAGIAVLEARISNLAYAPEIAPAMLQRQQAAAIVAARTEIVHGAVGIVDMALSQLQERGLADLDPERRAAMVSNLLVVLTSESRATPVINTGSLYS